MSSVDSRQTGGVRRVYVRSLPVRLCHWTIFFCVVVLTATGIFIAHPYMSGASRGEPFLMGTVRIIHFYTAIIFDVAFAAELGLILLGGRFERWDQYIPLSRKRWRSIVESLKYYVFLRRRPPATIAHDGLDGLIFIIGFAIDVLIICTGFALWADITSYNSPLALLGFLVPIFGGLQTARLIHHALMWVMIAYVLQHVIRAVTLSAIKKDGTMDSIFSGYKYVTLPEVAEFEGKAALDEIRR